MQYNRRLEYALVFSNMDVENFDDFPIEQIVFFFFFFQYPWLNYEMAI